MHKAKAMLQPPFPFMRIMECICLKCPWAKQSFNIVGCKGPILSVASVRSSLISKQLGHTKRAHKSLTPSADVKESSSAVLSDSMLGGALIKGSKGSLERAMRTKGNAHRGAEEFITGLFLPPHCRSG